MSRMESRRPVTIDDMYYLPKDGRKYELVDGAIAVSPSSMLRGEIVTKISHIFATFLDQHPVGKVYGDSAGLIFPTGNLRLPDVSFAGSDKLRQLRPGLSPESFDRFVPDLAVEVLSPADRPRRLADRIGEFLECGVQIVWLVDPQSATITVYRSLSNIHQFTSTDIISAEPLLPGFACPVSRIFQ